jgi:hypothetical protein
MLFADEPHTWMISPHFIRDDGSSFPTGQPIPRVARANMFVISTEVRPLVRPIATVGRKVRMVEGSHAVAVGEVTAIKNLPNDLAEHEGAASAFALPARAYLRWFWATIAEEVKVADMQNLHELLARLQAAAALLPAVWTAGEDSPRIRRKTAADSASNIMLKLPVKEYSFVFNPLDEKERDPVLTALGNDLEDIYKNINDGLELYDAGSYQDALWTWQSLYYVHWGRHLSHAQTAIWQYLSQGNWR